ncbi:MAG: potassium-transporting ATPase subunit F [Tildeniella nuda ZEHNDER 1965/U140]|jgi:type IV pilus assembly protein PilO|nr:potassium-transporting ATPase subunit F [Tildeniella nuda ZEHNDER 1965/U140]
MTAGGDFLPNDPNLDTEPGYPVIFGIALTPTILGILLAVGGIALAAYLFLSLVQPELEKYNDLKQKVETKENQVQQAAAIAKQIADANANLEAAKKQRTEVLNLFSNESTLNTLLLDLNRQVETRNAGVARLEQDRLAACPAWVRNNVEALRKSGIELARRASLKDFTPDPKASGVITDNAYGSLVNNKLQRQVATVNLEGNVNQTQAIFRNIERLQPFLVFKDVKIVVGDGTQTNTSVNRLFEIRGNTVQFLPNCQPEQKLTTTFRLEALSPIAPAAPAAAVKPAPAPAK